MAEYKFQEPKNLEEFHKLISENKKVVIDFHATWCGPCKLIAPKFKAFALEHPDVVFAKVDVDEVPDVAAEVAVRAMPTFAFYQNGQKIDDVVGANAGKLQQAIESLSKA